MEDNQVKVLDLDMKAMSKKVFLTTHRKRVILAS